ncbi:MAG: type II secretion system F family protein [Planctomycetota bacterium]|jgi:type II secretory pathway component PulF
MATFKYNALTSAGRLMRGTLEAGSHEEAGDLLGRMQLTVNSVEPAKPERPKTAIGRNEFMLFNQQLASIAKAGIPLERGLRELAQDVASKSMRRLIEDVADELEAGVSIEEAFEKRHKRFPPLYGRILKAGVETGRLSEMLTSLNRHLDLASQTRRIIFEAVSYPAIVFLLALAVVTLLFTFVIPAFGPLLTDMLEYRHLPAPTRLLLAAAANIVPFWIGVAVVIGALAAVFGILSTSAEGRQFKESVFLRVPVIGRVFQRLGSTAAGSEKLLLESQTLAGQIEQGNNILEAGQFCRVIPRLFLYSIQLGIQRNELQDNLYSLGQMYSEQTRYRQTRLQTVLMPAMILAVGIFVMFCILAIFLPMMQVITGLSSM